jgi:hypothetical protein
VLLSVVYFNVVALKPLGLGCQLNRQIRNHVEGHIS